jgi:ethanolamine utilization protein EutA (predicted chaperonin)
MGQNNNTQLSKKYPNIEWMIQDGTIEITREYRKKGLTARAIDEGGVIWEGEELMNLDDALNALEKGIGVWYKENM